MGGRMGGRIPAGHRGALYHRPWYRRTGPAQLNRDGRRLVRVCICDGEVGGVPVGILGVGWLSVLGYGF
jgi:hypothetical protein